jgi:molybdenum cofactor cytidylyltransferase
MGDPNVVCTIGADGDRVAYGETREVPAIFPRQAMSDLPAVRGDKEARALLQRPPLPVISIALAGGGIDIDSPEDLAQLG